MENKNLHFTIRNSKSIYKTLIPYYVPSIHTGFVKVLNDDNQDLNKDIYNEIKPYTDYSLVKDKIEKENFKFKIGDKIYICRLGMYPQRLINDETIKLLFEKKQLQYKTTIKFLYENCEIYDAVAGYLLKYKNYWFSFDPIEWIFNEKEGKIVAKDIIIPSMNFKDASRYLYTDFVKDIFVIDNLITKNSEKEVIEVDMTNQKKNDINETIKEINTMIDNGLAKSKKRQKNTNFTYIAPHLKNNIENGIYLTDKTYTINPAIGRENEIRELEKNLLIPKKSAILVGNSGVGKTAVVEGLAYNIQQGKVCDLMKNKGIISVDVNSLLAGCVYRGEFEAKIQKLCENLINSKDIILFIDEMHTTIGAGNSSGQSLDMANMLKTYISNDLIKVIGCTTNLEYEQYFSGDKAFRRRFNTIEVKEPDTNVVKTILKSYFNELTNRYKIKINLTDNEIISLIDVIIYYSKRISKFSYERLNNPDSAINILTNCFAYLAIENVKNATYEDFIDGIIDNKSLNITKMEIDNKLPQFQIEEVEEKDKYKVNRKKIEFISKK